MVHRLTTTTGITRAALAGLVILHVASGALADGKYFGARTVAGEADPHIPFQRAIVSWRDGVETMIVEAAVQGTGGDLGWVIPLPAEPTSITAHTPGALRSTYQLIGPRIEIDDRPRMSVALFVVVLLICLLVVADNRRQGRDRGTRLARMLVVASLVFVMAAVLLPALGTASRSGSAAGVEVLQHEQVGSYDVSIIAGRTAEPLRQWLDENGFSLPEAAIPVLAEYSSRGWCFAVSRITATEKSVLSPHPLQFVFSTPEAVYPMKLTGVGAQEMQLDLYVIGAEAATAQQLERISCDTYHPSASEWAPRLDISMRAYFQVTEGKQFEADHIRTRVGHPAITESMWPGCTLTHLRGRLDAQDMREDFVLRWESSESVHKTLYAPKAARAFGYTVALGCGSVVLLAVAIWAAVRTGPPKRWRWFLRSLLTCLILSCATGWAAYAFVPKTTAVPKTPGEAWWARAIRSRQLATYEVVLGAIAEGQVTPDFAAFDQWWRARFAAVDQWWARVRPERSPDVIFRSLDLPGGYTVERVGNDWLLTIYDIHATPVRFRVKATPPTGDTESG